MKRGIFFIVIMSLLLTKCSDQRDNNVNNIVINGHTINKNSELVFSIENISKNDVLILNYEHEILPKVYKKKINDSIWHNITFPFYDVTRILLDTSVIFHQQNELLKYKLNKNRPEVNNFYCMVINRIKESGLSMQSDLLLEFDDLICNSIFLKQGESYLDTIKRLSSYSKMYPEDDLKFIFTYPGIYLHGTEISYLDFYIKSILSDSLGITLPSRLDGYEVCYDELLKFEIIINAGN